MHRKGQTIYLTKTEREHVFFMLRPDGCFPNDVTAFNTMLDKAIHAFGAQPDQANQQLTRALRGLVVFLRRTGNPLATSDMPLAIHQTLPGFDANTAAEQARSCKNGVASPYFRVGKHQPSGQSNRLAIRADVSGDEAYWHAEMVRANVAILDAEITRRARRGLDAQPLCL
jgi:hypothetical protein